MKRAVLYPRLVVFRRWGFGRGATAASNALVHFVRRAPRVDRPGIIASPELRSRPRPFASLFAACCNSRAVDVLPQSQPRLRVIIGPYNHHSSILPWRESGADMYFVDDDLSPAAPALASDCAIPCGRFRGGVNLSALHRLLARLRAEDATAPIVCVFAAASNTTGACSFSPSTLHQVGDDGGDFATAIAHAHGALAFWDFAAYASHAPVVMNPPGRFSLSQMLAGTPSAADPDVVRDGRLHDARRDAVYFSGHKFVGGPGAPGVLLLKRALLSEDAVPNMSGGGTVLFVLKDGTPTYFASGADKEEGGSPDSLAAARMGLAMRLVASVGWETMSAREEAMADFAR